MRRQREVVAEADNVERRVLTASRNERSQVLKGRAGNVLDRCRPSAP